jgi:hypothetical protein
LSGSRVSTWNTAGRPTGKLGRIGYNFELDQLELYNGSVWKKVGLTDI